MVRALPIANGFQRRGRHASDVQGGRRGARRGLLGALAALALAATAAVVWLVPTAAGAPQPGRRVTIALFGDSVTESLLVPNFVQNGLAPHIARALTSQPPFTSGAQGFIPAAPFRFKFNSWVGYDNHAGLPPNGWWIFGYELFQAFDGASEYSAITASPQATARVAVSDPDVDVLYASSSAHCPFTVTDGAQTWSIDTYRPGPPADTGTPITVPPGRQVLTVHGPACGALWFNGIVDQRPVAPGQIQVEVDNLGHSGRLPSDGFTTRVQQAIAQQHYDITVFLYAYIGEVVGGRGLRTQYVNSMMARARIARAGGGKCLIVAPTPMPVSGSLVSQVKRYDQQVAQRAGCAYTTVLANLWKSPAEAATKGLVLVDGIHPTTKGYALIAHALGPVIDAMVRARLHLPPLPSSSKSGKAVFGKAS